MLEGPLRTLAWLVNRIRLNRSEFYVEQGVPRVRKTRHWGGTILIVFANWFLACTRSGVRMFVDAKEWTEWEADCVRLLYPTRPAVAIGRGSSVSYTWAAGSSLRQLLAEDALTVPQVVAVARELHRVHQLPCPRFPDGWSHGDLHLDNCLVDPIDHSVVLIDFDICHDPQITAIQRHADDLHTALLELLAKLRTPWQPFASAFVTAYADPVVLSELRCQLKIPRGVRRIWWQTKIYGCPIRVIAPRLNELREIISEHLQACGRAD